MEIVLSYRHRAVTASEVTFIRNLITEHPGSSRRELSKKLCQAWNWVQANGALRDMVCRGLMLQLHREGHIELPPVKFVRNNPLAQRVQPTRIDVDDAPLHTSFAGIGPVEVRQVRRTDRKSTRLNSSHANISYAVFCLKK